MNRIYILLLTVSLCNSGLFAQNITGTWEGTMGHEYLQLNIKVEKGKICGYTYDRFINDPGEYCKAYFTGKYYPEAQGWTFTGVEFIENSGSHVLMQLNCWFANNNNELIAIVRTKSALGFRPGDRGERVVLRRVSRNPMPLPGLPVCYIPPKPKPEPVTKPVPPPSVTKPPVTKVSPKTPEIKVKPKPPVTIVPSKPAVKPKINPSDTARPVLPVIVKKNPVITRPVTPAKDTVAKKVTARKRAGVRRLEVHVKNITLDVYDNGIIDGDTVSIFFNGKLLVNKKLLSARPLTFKLELDENAVSNEVVMYAENLGSIPPNTALIVVTAGDKRFELHSSANLEENAVLVFDYVPK